MASPSPRPASHAWTGPWHHAPPQELCRPALHSPATMHRCHFDHDHAAAHQHFDCDGGSDQWCAPPTLLLLPPSSLAPCASLRPCWGRSDVAAQPPGPREHAPSACGGGESTPRRAPAPGPRCRASRAGGRWAVAYVLVTADVVPGLATPVTLRQHMSRSITRRRPAAPP